MEAGTPGLSNKKVVPHGLVNVNFKSPTHVCVVFILTLRLFALVIEFAGSTIVEFTPVGLPSGIERLIVPEEPKVPKLTAKDPLTAVPAIVVEPGLHVTAGLAATPV